MSKTIKIKSFLFIVTVLVVMVVVHSSEAKSLKKGEVYRSWDGKKVVEVISENEVEITGGGNIILAQYSFKNGKLRIVFTALGTKMVEYYELTHDGLKDRKGNVLYSKSAFAEAKQKEKETQKQKELLAKKEHELEKQKVQIVREEKLRKIEKLNLDELSSADASRIVVKSIIKLGKKNGILKISPKGNYILYSTYNSPLAQIIETESFKKTKSIEIIGKLSCATWSPDGTKIAYCPGRHGKLNIVNIDSGKSFELPFPGYSHDVSEILWYSESEIYIHSRRNYFAFNLNTLEKKPLVEQRVLKLLNPLDKTGQQKQEQKLKEVEKQKKNIQKLFSQNLLEKSYIYVKDIEDVKGVGRSLIVANKDNSFSRVLTEGTSFEASQKLRYFVFNKSEGAFVAFLGLREEPKIIFILDLDKTKQLNEKQKEQFEEYFKGGTINGYFDKPQSFIIWGKVYSPKFNPLNNRVIGPDKKKFKGWVKFIESNDSFSIVKATFEIKPIKEGDIVSNIYSDHIRGRSFGLSSKIWAVLKYGNSDQRNEKRFHENSEDPNTYNARRIESTKQSPVYTKEKAKTHLSKPRARIKTNCGTITLELYPRKAPKTIENFLQYAHNGFYDGTIFHRVIKGVMIQGGGLNTNMQEKPARNPVINEADNGLKNIRGTVAMARLNDPHSATAQFFINTANNNYLNFKRKNAEGWGYCVFGKVVEGMDVVNTIENLPTITKGNFHDVPADQVFIESIIIEENSQQSNSKMSENNKKTDDSHNISSSVFTTNNSNIYHKSNCPELNTKDLIKFSSPKKARKSGGIPCSNCNP